jgi:hypothetical protein
MRVRALAARGTTRTSDNVRFSAVVGGIADITRLDQGQPIYEYTA